MYKIRQKQTGCNNVRDLANCLTTNAESFGEIASELKIEGSLNSSKFQASLAESRDILTQAHAINSIAEKSLSNITGGNSFVYLLWDSDSPVLAVMEGSAVIHNLQAKINETHEMNALVRSGKLTIEL